MTSRNENKTRPGGDLDGFIKSVAPERRRRECDILLELFGRATGMRPQLWGDSIVGYGRYYYKTGAGREGEFFLTGFAPRKAAISVHIMPGFDKYQRQLDRLGPHRHSVSCLYLANLSKIDLAVLEEIVIDSVKRMQDRYDWWSS